MRDLSEGIAPEVKKEMRETYQSFIGILTEEQRKKFLSLTRSRIGAPISPNGGRFQGPPKFKPFDNQSPVN